MTELMKAIRAKKLQKVFKPVFYQGNTVILRYLTNVYDGISHIYEYELYIVRTSEKVYRLVKKRRFTATRKKPPEYITGFTFNSIVSLVSHLEQCRSEIGCDENGKIFKKRGI